MRPKLAIRRRRALRNGAMPQAALASPQSLSYLRTPPRCWWLHPLAVVFCLHIPVILASHWLSADIYQNQWKTRKYLNSDSLIIMLASVAAMAIGFATINGIFRAPSRRGGQPQGPKVLSPSIRKDLEKFRQWSIVLTYIGAAAWVVMALFQGLSASAITGFLKGDRGAGHQLKYDYFATAPGITTLMELGMAAVTIMVLLYYLDPNRSERSKWPILALIGLNGIRAFLLSERLALIEVAIPAVVLMVHFKLAQPQFSTRGRRLVRMGPVVGILAVFLMFTVFESFRSWTFYSSRGNSLIEFASARFLGYYATAVNNSALIYSDLHLSPEVPYFTQQWFWKMPGIKSVLGVDEAAKAQYGALLEQAANSEFNNPGGFLLPLNDYGTVGGLIYWALFGGIVGWIYDRFKRYELLGLLLYPLIYMGLLELPRVLYLSDGRSFPSLAMLSLAAGVCALKGVRMRRFAGNPVAVVRYPRVVSHPTPQLSEYTP